MELADMRDLGSRAERRAGSTPVTRTTSSQASYRLRRLFYALHQKPSRAHSAAPPLRIKPACGWALIRFCCVLKIGWPCHACQPILMTLRQTQCHQCFPGLKGSEIFYFSIDDRRGFYATEETWTTRTGFWAILSLHCRGFLIIFSRFHKNKYRKNSSAGLLVS